MARVDRWPSIPAVLAAFTTLVACGPARAQTAVPVEGSSGGTMAIDGSLGHESAGLAALREVEAPPSPGSTAARAPLAAGALDPATLRIPEIMHRLTPTLLETAERYRSDRRSWRTLRGWFREAGKYRARIEQILRAEALPADLLWVVAAESGFNPGSESSAGAVGLWQLMPDTARSYGLRVDAWVDERRDPEKATRAASRLLRDLHARFGSWELALAAYNMGYGALLRSIRRFGTNDFDVLAGTEGGLPFETARYVPRILSLALAANNLPAFALADAQTEPALAWDDVLLSRSVAVDAIARGLSVDPRDLRRLNPALLGGRTPIPTDPTRPFVLHVPSGATARIEAALAAIPDVPVRTARLRWGESVAELAASYGMSARALLALSGLPAEHRVTGGTELFVPAREPHTATDAERPWVLVSPVASPPPHRTRVFYRAGVGDTLREIARALEVSRDELVAWNQLDPAARVPSGLWLQAWVEREPTLARVRFVPQVEAVERGTDVAAERLAAQDGRVRLVVSVRPGDTMSSLAARYGLTTGSLSRINLRSRHATLVAGESLIVWVTPDRAERERAREGDTPRTEPGSQPGSQPATQSVATSRMADNRPVTGGHALGAQPAVRDGSPTASEASGPSVQAPGSASAGAVPAVTPPRAAAPTEARATDARSAHAVP
jgi:membrane-bound lytic murein transglycosylase D